MQVAAVAAIVVSTTFSYLFVVPSLESGHLTTTLGGLQGVLLLLGLVLYGWVSLVDPCDPSIAMARQDGPLYCESCDVRSLNSTQTGTVQPRGNTGTSSQPRSERPELR